MAKSGTSERQKIANRENAKKSTGPKSAQGKEITRRNAVKHGLAGKAQVVPDEIAGEMEARADQWAEIMKPGEGVEAWLVARAAKLSVRVDAAVECESKRRASRGSEAEIRARAKEAAEALGRAFEKQKDPSEIVIRLESTAAGCEWMIEQWKDMEARRSEGRGSWEREELDLALKLIGRTLRDLTGVNEVEDLVRAYCCSLPRMERDKAMQRRLKYAKNVNNLETNLPADERSFEVGILTERDARNQLGDFMSRQIRRLTALRDELAEQEGESAGEGDIVDLSDEGERLRRYEISLERQLHHALKGIEMIRKGRKVAEVVSGAEPSTSGLPLADGGGVEDSVTATHPKPWTNPDGSTDWDKFNAAIRKARGIPEVEPVPVETSLRNGAISDGNAGEQKDLETISLVPRDFGVRRPDAALDGGSRSVIVPPHVEAQTSGAAGDLVRKSGVRPPHSKGEAEGGEHPGAIIPPLRNEPRGFGVRRPDAALDGGSRNVIVPPHVEAQGQGVAADLVRKSGVGSPHSKGEAEGAEVSITATSPLRNGAISDENACEQKDLETISTTRPDLGVVDGGQCPPDIARSEPFCRVGTAHLSHQVSDGRLAGGEETRQPEAECRSQDAGSRPSLQSVVGETPLRDGAISDGNACDQKDLEAISPVPRDFGVRGPDEAFDHAQQSGGRPPHSKGVQGGVEATPCEALRAGVGVATGNAQGPDDSVGRLGRSPKGKRPVSGWRKLVGVGPRCEGDVGEMRLDPCHPQTKPRVAMEGGSWVRVKASMRQFEDAEGAGS